MNVSAVFSKSYGADAQRMDQQPASVVLSQGIQAPKGENPPFTLMTAAEAARRANERDEVRIVRVEQNPPAAQPQGQTEGFSQLPPELRGLIVSYTDYIRRKEALQMGRTDSPILQAYREAVPLAHEELYREYCAQPNTLLGRICRGAEVQSIFKFDEKLARARELAIERISDEQSCARKDAWDQIVQGREISDLNEFELNQLDEIISAGRDDILCRYMESLDIQYGRNFPEIPLFRKKLDGLKPNEYIVWPKGPKALPPHEQANKWREWLLQRKAMIRGFRFIDVSRGQIPLEVIDILFSANVPEEVQSTAFRRCLKYQNLLAIKTIVRSQFFIQQMNIKFANAIASEIPAVQYHFAAVGLSQLGRHKYNEEGGKNPYADWHPMLPDLQWFKQLIKLPEFQMIHPQSAFNCACHMGWVGDWDFVRELIRIQPEGLILPDDLYEKEYAPEEEYLCGWSNPNYFFSPLIFQAEKAEQWDIVAHIYGEAEGDASK